MLWLHLAGKQIPAKKTSENFFSDGMHPDMTPMMIYKGKETQAIHHDTKSSISSQKRPLQQFEMAVAIS